MKSQQIIERERKKKKCWCEMQFAVRAIKMTMLLIYLWQDSVDKNQQVMNKCKKMES